MYVYVYAYVRAFVFACILMRECSQVMRWRFVCDVHCCEFSWNDYFNYNKLQLITIN